jgi:diguanylate cyclase (GGDEF)-like protein
VTLVRSAGGQPRYFIAQFIDISERKRIEDDLRQLKDELEARVGARTRELATANRQLKESNQRLHLMARTDPLTGLYNRWELVGTLERQLHESQRYATDWCLMLIDIDHFKELNDRHGHVTGDRALEAFGKIIHQQTRETDSSCRYGGDEFCVLVPRADTYHTGQLAAKLRETLAAMELYDVAGRRIKLSCSIGIVQWNPQMDTVEKLIESVDAQLYRAKIAGRNRVEGIEGVGSGTG